MGGVSNWSSHARFTRLQRGPARRPGWASGTGCGTVWGTWSFNEARPGGRDGRSAPARRPWPPTARFNEARPGGRDGRGLPDAGLRVHRRASTRPGPEAGMGGSRGRPRERPVAASTRPGPEAGMGVVPRAAEQLRHDGASTRPGPEAGMGAVWRGDAATLSGLQRGPARRPGWASQNRLMFSPAKSSLQRGPARRPGWARPARQDGPEAPQASTRPGPEAGMGGGPPASPRPPSSGFNEARPGGRDGRA